MYALIWIQYEEDAERKLTLSNVCLARAKDLVIAQLVEIRI
jgi:hypothetical protein